MRFFMRHWIFPALLGLSLPLVCAAAPGGCPESTSSSAQFLASTWHHPSGTSTAAPGPTSTRNGNGADAEAGAATSTFFGPIPASCYSSVSSALSGAAAVSAAGPDCFTYSVTSNAAICPTPLCEEPTTPIVCPQYIKVSSTTVPCATDCCPATPTETVVRPTCSHVTCDPCHIPTEWVTYTTGCPGTPTMSSKTIVTPT